MRQSVVKDYWGNIVKYNHSKWMTITGHWGGPRGEPRTFTGSANWANLAFGSDEQMQRISGRTTVLRYNGSTTKPGAGRLRPPAFGRVVSFGRTYGQIPDGPDVPEDAPPSRHRRLPLHDARLTPVRVRVARF